MVDIHESIYDVVIPCFIFHPRLFYEILVDKFLFQHFIILSFEFSQIFNFIFTNFFFGFHLDFLNKPFNRFFLKKKQFKYTLQISF